jgi:hypothetical protein
VADKQGHEITIEPTSVADDEPFEVIHGDGSCSIRLGSFPLPLADNAPWELDPLGKPEPISYPSIPACVMDSWDKHFEPKPVIHEYPPFKECVVDAPVKNSRFIRYVRKWSVITTEDDRHDTNKAGKSEHPSSYYEWDEYQVIIRTPMTMRWWWILFVFALTLISFSTLGFDTLVSFLPGSEIELSVLHMWTGAVSVCALWLFIVLFLVAMWQVYVYRHRVPPNYRTTFEHRYQCMNNNERRRNFELRGGVFYKPSKAQHWIGPVLRTRFADQNVLNQLLSPTVLLDSSTMPISEVVKMYRRRMVANSAYVSNQHEDMRFAAAPVFEAELATLMALECQAIGVLKNF